MNEFQLVALLLLLALARLAMPLACVLAIGWLCKRLAG
jgi:hypothetical protein